MLCRATVCVTEKSQAPITPASRLKSPRPIAPIRARAPHVRLRAVQVVAVEEPAVRGAAVGLARPPGGAPEEGWAGLIGAYYWEASGGSFEMV